MVDKLSLDVGRLAVIMRLPADEEKKVAGRQKLHDMCSEVRSHGVHVDPYEYTDAVRVEVERGIKKGGYHGVIVWCNPVQDGEDRTKLDNMLARLASFENMWVSAHPTDVIARIGTKEVIYDTRNEGWGCADTHIYRSKDEFRKLFPGSLTRGARIVKEVRGSSGANVWKVELKQAGEDDMLNIQSAGDDHVDVLSEEGAMDMLLSNPQCCVYVNQPFLPRVGEGMFRVYMVRDHPVGMLHQLPKPGGLNVSRSGLVNTEGLSDGSRIHMDKNTNPIFDHLSTKLTEDWIPALCKTTQLKQADLPVIWDVDFLLGPPDKEGRDTYRLCEINCSCVFPDKSLHPLIAEEIVPRITEFKNSS